tara:strand:+ start:1703 stop:2128 length:426 start_codon:yes stop_codon:yes gene_type:complete
MTYEQYLQKFGMKRGQYDPNTLLSGLEQEFGIEGIGSMGMMPYISDEMLDRLGITPYSKELQYGHEAIIDSLSPKYNPPKEIHGRFDDSYAVDTYGKKVKSDFLTQSSKLLGQVQEKQSKSRSIVDELIKQAYANMASLAD